MTRSSQWGLRGRGRVCILFLGVTKGGLGCIFPIFLTSIFVALRCCCSSAFAFVCLFVFAIMRARLAIRRLALGFGSLVTRRDTTTIPTGSSSSSSGGGGGSGDLVGLLPLTSLRAKCLSELGVSDGPLEQLAPSLGVRHPQPCLPLQEVREPRLDGQQRCYHVGMDSGD